MDDSPTTIEEPLQMVPGPTQIISSIRDAYQVEFGSSDLEPQFPKDYNRISKKLGEIIGAKNQDVVIMMGEGMLGLWAGLKSVIYDKSDKTKVTKTLAISTGVYGTGVGEMAKQCGSEVEFIEFKYDQVVSKHNVKKIVEKINESKPDLVTMIHCDTPCGTLNGCLKEIGAAIKAANKDALFYVDFVSSAGGAVVDVDEWQIDIGLWGTQKALSCPPSLSIVSVSNTAWKRIEERAYAGYDALLPFKDVVQAGGLAPYTFDWNAMLALERAADALLAEGMDAVVARHRSNAQYCVEQLRHLGLKIHACNDAAVAPTCVAFHVPSGWTFSEFDAKLRSMGVVLAGSYGSLADHVVRIGVMGSQSNREMIDRVIDVLRLALASGP